MDKERWKQIDDLVERALELPEAEREKFVSDESFGDLDLKEQVLALLEAEKASDNFMADSAMNLMAREIAEDSTNVFTNSLYNKKIGNYKIQSLLGAGGMGEVYLAQDEKLNRNVALKILPREFHANDERVKRFETEAKAIATLNHPNIVTIHDFGKDEGVNYIATEFVEGKTVREIIDEKPPLKKVLSIILQSLDALSSAHGAGIIHRDIKPENIMVREDGYVKILDFGLVKLTEQDHFESGMFAKTLEDVVIGTPAYMSPEQASGEKVDHRTDLWSIGLVFYEMLAGKNPFKQKNHKETIQAILSKEVPPISEANPEISTELDGILNKALEKDADLSYQTASDFQADVKRVKREIDSSSSWRTNSLNGGHVTTEVENRRSFLPYLIGGLALILAAFGIWFFIFQNETVEAEKWETAKVIQLTEETGKEYFSSISPDGKTFVYASNENGKFDIYSRRIGSKKSINLTANSEANDNQPSFSADGNFIAFRSNREPLGIYIMEVTGENPKRISDFGFHPAWSPDGKQIAVSEKGNERPDTRRKSAIWIIDIASGEKRKLIDNYAYQPSWSPNGKRIAYWFIGSGGRRDVATISVEGGEPNIVTDSANTNWNPVWSPDGKHLYFASDRSGNMAFWRIQINQKTGQTIGDAEIVPTPAKFNSHLSFSKDGKKIVYVQTNTQSNIKAIEFDENAGKVKGEPFAITSGDYEFIRPIFSSKNDQLVFVQKKLTQDDIVVLDREGKNRRDLTDDRYFDRYPRWSPDGKKLAFTSDRSGVYNIWVMQKDGANLQQMTFSKSEAASFPIWSSDGKKIAYTLNSQTYLIDLTKDIQNQKPAQLAESSEKRGFIAWDWSPDGKKLTGIYHRTDGWSGIGYYSFETEKYEKLHPAIGFPFWLPNSKQLVYSWGEKVHFIDIETGENRDIFELPGKNINNASLSPDGKLLHFVEYKSESNIWLLDNTAGETSKNNSNN